MALLKIIGLGTIIVGAFILYQEYQQGTFNTAINTGKIIIEVIT